MTKKLLVIEKKSFFSIPFLLLIAYFITIQAKFNATILKLTFSVYYRQASID